MKSFLKKTFLNIAVLLVVFLYDFAFGGGGGLNSLIGNIGFLAPIARDSMVGTIPESLYAMFQLTFAIITQALIVGGIAQRMKISTRTFAIFLVLIKNIMNRIMSLQIKFLMI